MLGILEISLKFVKGKEVPLTRKDLVGQGEYYKNKIVTKNELKRFKKDLKIPSVGKPRIYEKTLFQYNVTTIKLFINIMNSTACFFFFVF